MFENELIELLAAIVHDQWSSYMEYLFSKLARQEDGSYVISAEYAANLQKQINSSYSELTEEEKQYDRDEVDKIMPSIKQYALTMLC